MLFGHAMVTPHYHPGRLNSGWKLESILAASSSRSFETGTSFRVFLYFCSTDRSYTADQIVPLKIINVHEEREVGFSFDQPSPTIEQSGYLHARDRPFAMQIRSPCVS